MTTETAGSPIWRRVTLATGILFSIQAAALIVILIPYRVADCGPADPFLIRHLGAPLFSGTGHSIASSLESNFWLLPLLMNIAINGGFVFAALWLLSRFWPWRASWLSGVLLAILGLMLLYTLGVTIWFFVEANKLWIWGRGFAMDTENCVFFWEFAPDTRGAQMPLGQ